jgi:hypothetical protein
MPRGDSRKIKNECGLKMKVRTNVPSHVAICVEVNRVQIDSLLKCARRVGAWIPSFYIHSSVFQFLWWRLGLPLAVKKGVHPFVWGCDHTRREVQPFVFSHLQMLWESGDSFTKLNKWVVLGFRPYGSSFTAIVNSFALQLLKTLPRHDYSSIQEEDNIIEVASVSHRFSAQTKGGEWGNTGGLK